MWRSTLKSRLMVASLMDLLPACRYLRNSSASDLVTRSTGDFRKERQQELEVINMMRADRAAGDEARGEFAERHGRIGLDDLEALVVDFLLELGFDGLGLPAVGSPGRILVANAVRVEVGPPDVAALKQAHVFVPPCVGFRSSG